MTKLMTLLTLLCAIALSDPARVIYQVAPEARQIGWRLNHAIDSIWYATWWRGRRA